MTYTGTPRNYSYNENGIAGDSKNMTRADLAGGDYRTMQWDAFDASGPGAWKPWISTK